MLRLKQINDTVVDLLNKKIQREYEGMKLLLKKRDTNKYKYNNSYVCFGQFL